MELQGTWLELEDRGRGGGHTPSPTPILKPRPILKKKNLKCYKTQQKQEKGVSQGFASPSPFCKDIQLKYKIYNKPFYVKL